MIANRGAGGDSQDPGTLKVILIGTQALKIGRVIQFLHKNKYIDRATGPSGKA